MRRTEAGRFGRGRVVAAGLVAVLVPTGCGGPAPARSADAPVTRTSAPAVGFTASIEARGQALRIAYELTNSSGQDLIVLNRVPAYTTSGAPERDANAVYVTAGEPAGRVQIAKRAFAMPVTDRKTWTQAPRISGVLLGRGRSIGEELTIPLPLRHHHPYGDDLGDGTVALPDPVTDLVFCVGVIRATEAPPLSGQDDEGGGSVDDGSVTLPHLSSTTDVQHLSCSAPVQP